MLFKRKEQKRIVAGLLVVLLPGMVGRGWCDDKGSERIVPFIVGQGRPSAGPEGVKIPPSKGKREVFQARPGPWGSLEFYYTYLEAPEAIMKLVKVPSEKTIWHVPHLDLEGIRRLFDLAGMPRDAQESILQNSIPFQAGPPYRLYPPAQRVVDMPRENRAILYRELRKVRDNTLHFHPTIIESGNVEEHFANSGLSEEIVDLIESLTYKIGDTLVFSDLPVVLSQLHSEKEDRALLRAMMRTRTLALRLKVDDNIDFETLKSYWTANGANSEIVPYFDSVIALKHIDTVDVTQLLPPTPRKLIYTYPSFEMGLEGRFPDSFWTTMNFFRYLPDNSFNELGRSLAYAQKNFRNAEQPYRFGDLLVIKDPQSGHPVHGCVYIADNIVYTKNGRSMLSPFIFMKISDLLSLYAMETRPAIEVWRKISNP